MTIAESELNRGEPEAAGAAPCDNAVGHGRPPKEHQFKKGNRASADGKRRKVKPSEEVVPQLPNESVHGMLMAEAMRMVRVRAGGRLVEIPAMQAAFREIAMKAARGNRLAAATLARLIMQSEAAEARAAALVPAPAKASGLSLAEMEARRVRAFQSAEYKAAEEYKEIWTSVLTKAADLNAALAAPVPHPDEVTIGRVRGTAHWPDAAPGETLSLDRLAATHAELQADLPMRRPAIEAMVEGYDKAVAWCEWFALGDMRDLIAAHLPERYARQIRADERVAEARARDQSLRSMAQHDRRQHERRFKTDDAAEVRARALRAQTLASDWYEIRREEDLAGEEVKPVARAAPVVDIAGDPARTVAEARVYREAWAEVLDVTEGMKIRLDPPAPPPDDVMIDADAATVTYRVQPEPGKRATLDSLRDTLVRLTDAAAGYHREINWALTPQFAELEKDRRDQMLTLCAVVEWHLAGVVNGG